MDKTRTQTENLLACLPQSGFLLRSDFKGLSKYFDVLNKRGKKQFGEQFNWTLIAPDYLESQWKLLKQQERSSRLG